MRKTTKNDNTAAEILDFIVGVTGVLGFIGLGVIAVFLEIAALSQILGYVENIIVALAILSIANLATSFLLFNVADYMRRHEE